MKLMLFSKSFGYSVRSVLYISSIQNGKRYVQLDEIALQLSLPRQFTGRILKNLVKEKILISVKGPHGGFGIRQESLQVPLLRLLEISGDNRLDNCVLKKKNCQADNPCPIHDKFIKIREDLILVMLNTTIGDLVKTNEPDFIRSLS
jgi:Rrf2 family transcriptional regulator, iron-sulfur cluster assembly transcription factor